MRRRTYVWVVVDDEHGIVWTQDYRGFLNTARRERPRLAACATRKERIVRVAIPAPRKRKVSK